MRYQPATQRAERLSQLSTFLVAGLAAAVIVGLLSLSVPPWLPLTAGLVVMVGGMLGAGALLRPPVTLTAFADWIDLAFSDPAFAAALLEENPERVQRR